MHFIVHRCTNNLCISRSPSDILVAKDSPQRVAMVSWRMGECKPEVTRLGAALRDAGVEVIVIGELPGGDLLKAVTEGMEAADLFIIMGTKTFGKQTSGVIDTYQEMQYIKSSKKPFFLFNMNPEPSLMRFQEGAVNVVFNLNTISWERWEVGAPMPAKAVEKVLQKFAEAGAGGEGGKRENGSAKMLPNAVAQGGAVGATSTSATVQSVATATPALAQARLVEDVSAEDKALGEEMLALLELDETILDPLPTDPVVTDD